MHRVEGHERSPAKAVCPKRSNVTAFAYELYMKIVSPDETLATYSLPFAEPIRRPASLIPTKACDFHSHNLLKM
jgi:hypothetical protein